MQKISIIATDNSSISNCHIDAGRISNLPSNPGFMYRNAGKLFVVSTWTIAGAIGFMCGGLPHVLPGSIYIQNLLAFLFCMSNWFLFYKTTGIIATRKVSVQLPPNVTIVTSSERYSQP